MVELTLGVNHQVKIKLSRYCSAMSQGPCLHYLIDCNANTTPEVVLEERIGKLDCMILCQVLELIPHYGAWCSL